MYIHVILSLVLQVTIQARCDAPITAMNDSIDAPKVNPEEQSLNSEVPDLQSLQMRRLQDRLDRVNEKCQGLSSEPYWKNLNPGGLIWSFGSLNYCIVPKVGCTFWKRIMRFISKDYPLGQKTDKPSDIDRTYVHYGPVSKITQKNARNPIIRSLISKKAFMFSRDPYTRLWSAFIDKFFLPDFWRSDALSIMKNIRKNASEYELRCANNLTFLEFLMFVNKTSKGPMNEHWERVHRICSPCHLSFDVIGKLETFAADSDYILTKNGLERVQENTTRLDMTTEEVRTLTMYNFNLENAIKEGCYDKMDVAKRLWKTFQYNGYIHRDSEFPKGRLEGSDFLSKPKEVFTDLVFSTIKDQIKKGLETKSQKRTMMLEEYKKIPQNLLAAISEVYKYDFELFDYNKSLFQ